MVEACSNNQLTFSAIYMLKNEDLIRLYPYPQDTNNIIKAAYGITI